MSVRHAAVPMMWIASALSTSACVTRAPTIAHVHIGHALTGVHITPGHKGYVLVAEERADEAQTAAENASKANALAAIQEQAGMARKACDSEEDFGVKQSLVLAANHIAFAATSADATENVIRFAPTFKGDIAAVLGRCEYIGLLGKDIEASHSATEAKAIAGEMLKAAQANVRGDDSGNSGVRGAHPADYGMAQLRGEVEAMIARERPPYRTVDQWYLFNLVRLPNGRWVFDRLGRGGNIDGYK